MARQLGSGNWTVLNCSTSSGEPVRPPHRGWRRPVNAYARHTGSVVNHGSRLTTRLSEHATAPTWARSLRTRGQLLIVAARWRRNTVAFIPSLNETRSYWATAARQPECAYSRSGCRPPTKSQAVNTLYRRRGAGRRGRPARHQTVSSPHRRVHFPTRRRTAYFWFYKSFSVDRKLLAYDTCRYTGRCSR